MICNNRSVLWSSVTGLWECKAPYEAGTVSGNLSAVSQVSDDVTLDHTTEPTVDHRLVQTRKLLAILKDDDKATDTDYDD